MMDINIMRGLLFDRSRQRKATRGQKSLPLSGAVCPFAKRLLKPEMNKAAYRYEAAA
jgi:hypothetical protein